MIRPLLFTLFIGLISISDMLAQGQQFNDRLNWQSLFEISDMPAGPSREAKIAGFLFNRVPDNPYEWRRDMAQMINNRLYEWTESIVLIKDKHNVIRFVTTFSVEFRRMVDLLAQPESSLPGDEGVGASQLPSRPVSGGRFVEQFRKDDRLIEVLSYKDKTGMENWVCQITKGVR